jgi:paraquat-inducible protein B
MRKATMPATRSTAVGGFVLGGLVLAVVAILAFGGSRFFTTTVSVVVYFQDSVAGLQAGAPVTLSGVKIGTVRSMKVYVRLPNVRPIIPVYLEIEPRRVSWTNGAVQTAGPDIEQAIKEGLRAQLATDSLVTGQLSINLDFHPEEPATVSGIAGNVPEIPSMPSDLQHLKDQIAELKLPELADKARAALDGFQQLEAELNGKLGPIALSVRETSDAARVTLQTASDSVRTVQIDASRTLDSVDRLATSTQAQIQTAAKQIDQVMASAGKATARANQVLDSVNDLTGPHAPMRGDLEAAIRDLAASASSLRNFSHQIERNPSALLLGGSNK